MTAVRALTKLGPVVKPPLWRSALPAPMALAGLPGVLSRWEENTPGNLLPTTKLGSA